MFLLIEDHKESLESIERNGQVVKLIGKGLLKSPGHPAGNQSNERQLPIFRSGKFLIYNKDLENKIELLGTYVMLGYKIKLSRAGFRYYEFTMMRILLPLNVEPEFPPSKEE